MEYNKKTVFRWTMFDWANSAYSLIISSAIFPAYYSAIAPDKIQVGSMAFDKSVFASYSISLSFLIIVILSPFLSGIADYSSNKKQFMRIFSTLGSLACMAMVFFTKDTFGFGIFLSIVASVGYCGSLVFYNAFLPEIVPEDQQDKISARGFIMGYIGSVLLMVLCLVFIDFNDRFAWGLGTWPVRLSFLSVGIWWFVFAEYSLSALHDKPRKNQAKLQFSDYFSKGLTTLSNALQNIKKIPQMSTFLMAFLFYNMGVQTVMYMAVYFASSELKMNDTSLILTILIIQLIAIVGAFVFSRLSAKIGNVQTIVIIIITWIGICVGAYYTYTNNEFYILAAFVGLVMGGVQSLSRSTYSKLIPASFNENASFFSFYDVCDKSGTVIGTLTFGLVATLVGSFRGSVLALMTYFIIGVSILIYYLIRFSSKNKISLPR